MQASETREVDRPLRLSRPNECAAVPRSQREDMPRNNDIAVALGGIDSDLDGVRAVRC